MSSPLWQGHCSSYFLNISTQGKRIVGINRQKCLRLPIHLYYIHIQYNKNGLGNGNYDSKKVGTIQVEYRPT